MRRNATRRSFLALVVGAASFAGQEPTDTAPNPPPGAGPSDTDTGPGADPAGRPRRQPRSPLRDEDSGATADRPGCCGRRRPRGPRTGITDADSGTSADPAEYGRRGSQRPRGPRTGVTDRDSGAAADPPQYGRRSPCVDTDPTDPPTSERCPRPQPRSPSNTG